MKKVIKLFAAGLVVLASNSFAQTTSANDQKLAVNSNTTVSGANVTHLGGIKDQPEASKSISQHRRALRAQGLKGKELRHAIHERRHERNVAHHEQRMARRETQAGHADATHNMREHRADLAQKGVTPKEARQHREQVKSRKTTAHR